MSDGLSHRGGLQPHPNAGLVTGTTAAITFWSGADVLVDLHSSMARECYGEWHGRDSELILILMSLEMSLCGRE